MIVTPRNLVGRPDVVESGSIAEVSSALHRLQAGFNVDTLSPVETV
jgi:hypothetical protein